MLADAAWAAGATVHTGARVASCRRTAMAGSIPARATSSACVRISSSTRPVGLRGSLAGWVIAGLLYAARRHSRPDRSAGRQTRDRRALIESTPMAGGIRRTCREPLCRRLYDRCRPDGSRRCPKVNGGAMPGSPAPASARPPTRSTSGWSAPPPLGWPRSPTGSAGWPSGTPRSPVIRCGARAWSPRLPARRPRRRGTGCPALAEFAFAAQRRFDDSSGFAPTTTGAKPVGRSPSFGRGDNRPPRSDTVANPRFDT